MKEELRIDIVGLAGACSYALDCIEAELVKIKNKHGKRVAYISVCMAEYLAIQGDALQDLAMCALLHDNALTQYITEELERNYVIDIKKDLSVRKTNLHCIYGEKNITKLPFKTDVSNVILYHHEHADGLTFHVKGVYTDSLRSLPVKEHANGKIEITRICGPVAKVNDTTFTVRFYRMGMDNPRRTGDIWLLAANEGERQVCKKCGAIWATEIRRTEEGCGKMVL